MFVCLFVCQIEDESKLEIVDEEIFNLAKDNFAEPQHDLLKKFEIIIGKIFIIFEYIHKI